MIRHASALILSLLLQTAALCGTVITTNLPAGTVIVNVDGGQDGAATWNSGQDSWFHPFFTGGATALLQYTIQPGTYTFTLTDPTLAATQFPALTAAQRSQMFTAWTYNSPWVTDYFVWDTAGATNFSIPQIFAGAIRPAPRIAGEASAAAAFNHAVANDYDDNVTKQPGGRNTGVRTNQYTFTTTETLTFGIPDNILNDNNGGVSVVIAPAVTADPPGDYNDDGVVDVADFVMWRKLEGTSTEMENDSNPLPINDLQYITWHANFGETAVIGSGGSETQRVPELATWPLLLSLAAVSAFARFRERG
jgi:hypothetical protein